MAEIANGSVFSQTDGSNTGALPGITGASSPALIDNSIQALMGAIKRDHDWRNYAGTAGGSSNAYTLTFSVAPAAYYNPMRFTFKATFANTTAATLNVNSLGAKTIKKLVSGTKTDLASGDIPSGEYVDVVYDGTDFVWVNQKSPTYTPPSNLAVDDADNNFSAKQTFTANAALSRAAGTDRYLEFSTSGSLRFVAAVNSAAESGSNAGSDFVFWRFNDAGSFLGTPIAINRSTGTMTVEKIAGDGSSLTNLPVGITSLGSISTASGPSASLGSLTLTGYKFIRLMLKGVNGSVNRTIKVGNSTGDSVPMTPTCTGVTSGMITIDLTNAIWSTAALDGSTQVSHGGSTSPLTTGTTTITVNPSTGNWNAGTIYVYGER